MVDTVVLTQDVQMGDSVKDNVMVNVEMANSVTRIYEGVNIVTSSNVTLNETTNNEAVSIETANIVPIIVVAWDVTSNNVVAANGEGAQMTMIQEEVVDLWTLHRGKVISISHEQGMMMIILMPPMAMMDVIVNLNASWVSV